VSEPRRATFYVDENLSPRRLATIFGASGHELRTARLGDQDPTILNLAEEESAIVITADRWFLQELYRFPFGHRQAYSQAGVIQVPGEWQAAHRQLRRYVRVIEAVIELRAGEIDRRVGIDFSKAQIRIFDR
jgi:hypothetical protein